MSSRPLKNQLKRAQKALKAGRLADAKSIYFECCRASTSDARLWHELGRISYRLQHYQDACVAFQKTLSIDPNASEAYYELAQAQVLLGRYPEAEKNFRAYLMMRPEDGDGYWAYAKLLKDWGRIADATENYSKASRLRCDNARLHTDFGAILHQQGLYEEALHQYCKAQALQPGLADIYNRLGSLHRDAGRLELAVSNYRKAFELSPADEAVHHYYLGTVAEAEGDPSAALSHYDAALALNGQLIDAHLNKALCLLLLGRYQEGWVEYEWRLSHPDWLRQRHLQLADTPRWNGEPWPDKNILVIAEQGYGDTFQFCRYLPMLAKRFARTIVYCKAEIATLIASVAGVDEVITTSQELPRDAFDTHVYMMSLPHLFETALDNIPKDIPYLHAPEVLAAEWRKRLEGQGLKVGLAWSGSPANAKNAVRKIDLAELAPLGEVAAVSFFGLQKGPGSEQASRPPATMDFVDLSDAIRDFSDTAAVIAGLDLVISVDSAVAHLAGALGKPVWVLMYSPPDWRYSIKGEESPWYPSMRIFRQHQAGDWRSVVLQLKQALRERVGG